MLAGGLRPAGSAQQAPPETAIAMVEPRVGESVLKVSEPDRRWAVELSSESYTYVGEQKELGTEAPIYSLNGLGLKYKPDEKWSFLVMPYWELMTNRHSVDNRLHAENAWELDTVEFKVKRKTEVHVLGSSSPLSMDFHWFAPVSHLDRADRSAGVVRADFQTDWQMDPRWSVYLIVSPRAALNTTANAVSVEEVDGDGNITINSDLNRGADAEYYRLKISPYLNYAFNDALTAYYTYIIDVRSREAQRGIWRADADDTRTHEIGLYWIVGSWELNPAITSDTSYEDGSARLFDPGSSRAFSAENSYYTLNVYASF